MYHGPRCRHKVRLANMMPLFLLRHHAADEIRQCFVACAASHLRVQIGIPDREQAGASLSVACNSNAAAVSAERMRYRRDDANLANPIFKTVAPRRF